MGVQLSVKGDITNTWRWFDEVFHPKEEEEEEEENIGEEEQLAGERKGEGEDEGGSGGGTGRKSLLTTTTTTTKTTRVTTKTPTPPTTLNANAKPLGESAFLAEVIHVVEGMNKTTGVAVDESDHPGEHDGGGGGGGGAFTKSLVKAPPIGVVAGKIDRNIGVKIVSQEKMTLSFQAENRWVREWGDPMPHQPKGLLGPGPGPRV